MDEPGYYILLICTTNSIEVEYSRHTARLEPGLHAYIGSAQKGLRARIKRHLTKNKKIWWHIDKLTTHPQTRIPAVVACTSKTRGLEPCIAQQLADAGYKGPKGFGSTDNPNSPTHLFHISQKCDISAVKNIVERALRECCPNSIIIMENL